MPQKALSGVLGALGVGGSYRVSRAECDRLFPPGVQTSEGRTAAYAFANVHGCGIEWDDAANLIAFVKKPSPLI